MADEAYDDDGEKDPGADKVKQASRWKNSIADALKVEKDWRKSASRIVARYREEDCEDLSDLDRELQGSRFNILYANLAVLKPAIFQNAPRPDVRRRYDPEITGDDQAVKEQAKMMREAARQAASVLERGLTYMIDIHGMETEIVDCVSDMLLAGRGVLRVRYDPVTADEPVISTMTGEPVIDEATGKPKVHSRIIDQDTWAEHVYWEDFLTAPYRRWTKTDQPPWIAFRHLMTKGEMTEAFGPETARAVGCTWTSEALNADGRNQLGEADRAEIWEIWERKTRKVFWIAMGHSETLDEADDPLKLEGFYPVARPLYAIKTTDTLVPMAEYKVYADLAEELDDVQERIAILTKQLRASGVYNSSVEGLEAVLTAKDGEMLPMESFQLANGGKLSDHVLFWPIDTIIKVLQQLYVQREQIKQTIFEVVGISDILRGSTNPNETLGAQRIKTQFGTLRIDERRREVGRVLRDTLRMMAECIAEKFEPDIILRMTGIKMGAPVADILRSESLRGFMVDVETDSTVAPDEQAEQEAVTKLLTAITQFLSGMLPLVQAGMVEGEQVITLLRFAIRPFRGARAVEEALDEAERRVAEAEQAGADQGQGPPDAEAMEAQAEARSQEVIRDVDVQLKKLELSEAQKKAQSDGVIRRLNEQKAQVALNAAQGKAAPEQAF